MHRNVAANRFEMGTLSAASDDAGRYAVQATSPGRP